MAYFSNSTEGGIWEANNCAYCPADQTKCPILTAQQIYNSVQSKPTEENLYGVLSILIPFDDETGNANGCAMLEALKGQPDQHALPGFKTVEINAENGG